MTTPLVIAAHGTRLAEGVAACHELADLVRGRLPGVDVSVGFVELAEPSVPDAVVGALAGAPADQGAAVVVPLMLGTGGHVRSDIPGFIEEALAKVPGARVDYARHLGADDRLVAAVDQRLREAAADWPVEETTVVFVGRGCLVPEANADHVRLGRILLERGGWAGVETGFIQVTGPNLPQALDRAHAAGARRIVVMGHWVFPGLLRRWTHEQADAWASAHPDAEVRVAGVIGPCPELADVVTDRYREQLPAHGSPTYLSGLRLQGCDVLVVGGGRVATRRVPKLLDAGATVRLVAPRVSPELRGLADDGRLGWEQRTFDDADLDGVWYVLAATDDPAANARVCQLASANRIFCVRADDALAGTAWTPATEQADGLTVAVIGNRDPRRSKAVREAIVEVLSRAGE